MIKRKYKAVNVDELKSILGHQCSPDPRHSNNSWYVIGPDINNSLRHCATCSCEVTAKQYVDTLNKNIIKGKYYGLRKMFSVSLVWSL